MIGRYRRKRRRRKGRSGVGRWTLSRKCALSTLYSITSFEGLYTGILFLAVFLRSVRTTTCRFQPCVLYVYILERDSHKYPTWGHFAISRNTNNNCQCRHSIFYSNMPNLTLLFRSHALCFLSSQSFPPPHPFLFPPPYFLSPHKWGQWHKFLPSFLPLSHQLPISPLPLP